MIPEEPFALLDGGHTDVKLVVPSWNLHDVCFALVVACTKLQTFPCVQNCPKDFVSAFLRVQALSCSCLLGDGKKPLTNVRFMKSSLAYMVSMARSNV